MNRLWGPAIRSARRLGRVPKAPLPRLVIAISGPVRSGKTTLGRSLEAELGAYLLRTRDVLVIEYASDLREYISDPAVRDEREALQRLGDALDEKTSGEWVVS